MSSIKSARADWVKSGDKEAIMITMSFDEARLSWFTYNRDSGAKVVATFRDNPDHALTCALAAFSMAQGTPIMPALFDIDKVKTDNDSDAAFIAEARRQLAESVPLAEWSAKE